MISHRSTAHQTFLTGFLATVLVIAGIITGVKFAPTDVSPQPDIMMAQPIADIDLSGEWVGTTTENYGDEARYDYRIVFDQNGNQVTGILYLTRNHSRAIYTETSLSGTVDGYSVYYASDEILVIENASRDDLCLVQTTVEYQEVDGQDMLIGTWVSQPNQQSGCEDIHGQVLLTRNAE